MSLAIYRWLSGGIGLHLETRGKNRVVFNVGGNKYRLVVEVQYQAGIVWVKFVGTHAQNDRIDVESVNDY